MRGHHAGLEARRRGARRGTCSARRGGVPLPSVALSAPRVLVQASADTGSRAALADPRAPHWRTRGGGAGARSGRQQSRRGRRRDRAALGRGGGGRPRGALVSARRRVGGAFRSTRRAAALATCARTRARHRGRERTRCAGSAGLRPALHARLADGRQRSGIRGGLRTGPCARRAQRRPPCTRAAGGVLRTDASDARRLRAGLRPLWRGNRSDRGGMRRPGPARGDRNASRLRALLRGRRPGGSRMVGAGTRGDGLRRRARQGDRGLRPARSDALRPVESSHRSRATSGGRHGHPGGRSRGRGVARVRGPRLGTRWGISPGLRAWWARVASRLGTSLSRDRREGRQRVVPRGRAVGARDCPSGRRAAAPRARGIRHSPCDHPRSRRPAGLGLRDADDARREPSGPRRTRGGVGGGARGHRARTHRRLPLPRSASAARARRRVAAGGRRGTTRGDRICARTRRIARRVARSPLPVASHSRDARARGDRAR